MTQTLIMEIYDLGDDTLVQSHRVLWYSHNARDFISRTISWAARKGYSVEIFPETEGAENVQTD